MPLRLAVTGNLAGPDIGDQVQSFLEVRPATCTLSRLDVLSGPVHPLIAVCWRDVNGPLHFLK